jgi:hypothetical protein
MKLLNLLKTAIKPSYDREAKAKPPVSVEIRQLEQRWSSAAKPMSPSQARRQSEALRGLLKRADAIGSSR